MSANKYILILLSVVFFACSKEKAQHSRASNPESTQSPVEIKHATKFKVEEINGYTTVTVLKPWQGAAQNYLYILVPPGKDIPEKEHFRKNKNDIVQNVQVPIKSIVLTSTTFVPLLDGLEESESLVGFPGTDHISSPKTRRLIDEGKIANIGTPGNLNIERLIELNPDAVMDYAMQGENDNSTLARKAGIPVLFNADYLEKTPLGRAEWIKFSGLFFNKTAEADSIFSQLETTYDSLKALASKAEKQPSVYSGIVYGDTWFMPGGKNSGSQFINDAAGNYLWKHTPNEGSIKLSFESVYQKAHDADFWIGVASFESLQEIKNADHRYTNFKAYKEGNVYSYNKIMGEKGGTTFFELGYARPDLILADYIKILHPELLPEYELYFHKRLK